MRVVVVLGLLVGCVDDDGGDARRTAIEATEDVGLEIATPPTWTGEELEHQLAAAMAAEELRAAERVDPAVHLNELSALAAVVVVGEVTSISTAARTIETGDGTISIPFTIATVRVDDAVRPSSLPPSVEIEAAGGRVGEVTMHVSRQPLLQVGQRGIFFAYVSGSRFRLVGAPDALLRSLDGGVSVRVSGVDVSLATAVAEVD